MKNRNRVLTVVGLITLSVALTAGALVSAKHEREAMHGKIAPLVASQAVAHGEAEFLVVMAVQIKSVGAERLQGKEEESGEEAMRLAAVAQRSQGSLLSWLRTNGIRHQSFYIVNAVLVQGTREIVETIAARSDVARIEANPAIRNRPLAQPSAEDLARLAQRLTAPEAIESGITAIRAPEVWSMGASPTFKGEGIVIGSVDSGVQWDHPALKDRYRGWNGGSADHNYNWHDSIHSGGSTGCGPNSTAPCDDHNHGTHTVGTAVGDDGIGNQIGVAPKAKFIACRAMDQLVGTPASYIECLEWMLAPYPIGGTPAQGDPTKAPDIVLTAWNCPASEGCSSSTLQSAVTALRNAGIMVVAMSGSDGPTCSTIQDVPAIYDEVYTAGAFNANDPNKAIASFSSRGPVTIDGSNRIKPDITAPGVSVRSSVRGGIYQTFSGTSMAAAHMAGAVALLWSARPAYRHLVASTESLFNESAPHATTSNCSSTGIPNNVYGYGQLDVKAAVDLAGVKGQPLQFYPLPRPVRLLDTRPGQIGCDAPGVPIPGMTSRTQTIAGRTCDGITIPATAKAITGNITTVQPDAGYLTLYPSDAAQPTVANSNYASGEVLNNVYTVGVGAADGAFKIFVTTTTHLVVDVTGYYAPPGTGGLYFHALPKPIRLLETRAGYNGCTAPGTPLPGGVDTAQQARVTCDGVTIPATALSIVGNATTVSPSGPGFPYLTLFPANAARPLAASSNYLPGQVMNAPFTVGLSPAGEFKIYPTTQTDLIVDVLGYYSAEATDTNGMGLLFYPLSKPVRLLETRASFIGCFNPAAPLQANVERTQPARGICDGMTISAALGLVGNATVVNTAGNAQAGHLTFWPSDAAQPTVAASNFAAGQVFNRHFTVGLSAMDGAFKIISTTTTDLILDVSGYFAP